ncbi:MAG: hypothetical protein LCH63_10370 [Candidatus Melainabacteria bacterium]|nr:hypothetical protein [Candidatus Melainabacteria bacterium]
MAKSEKMVNVKMRATCALPDLVARAGKVVALPESLANKLIEGEYAELSKEQPSPEPVAEPSEI